MKDVRTMLNDFVGGLGKLGETNEAHVQARRPVSSGKRESTL